MANKKRQILAASLVAALALAVAVNWYYTRSAPEAGGTGQAEVQGRLGDSLLVAGTVQQDETGKAVFFRREAAAGAGPRLRPRRDPGAGGKRGAGRERQGKADEAADGA